MTTLLNKKQAAELVGLAPEYLMRMARAGRFPQPIKFGGRNSAVRFVQEEILEWIETKRAERDAKSDPVGKSASGPQEHGRSHRKACCRR